MFNYASITKKGSELLAQSVAGKTLVFTRMEYGNGVLEALKTITSETEIKALFLNVTALVSKKADIGMYSTKTSSNTTTLTGKIVNSSISEDFKAKELGVFAKIDGGTEVLFAYFSAVDYLSGKENDTSDFISQSALLGQEHKVVVNVATGNAANIIMEYNPEIYATKEEFDALVASNTAEHTAIQQSITDLEASVDEKIGSIDISSALSHIKQYDFVVDSNETLLAWANCTDGSMKSVLVKSGEYTLDGKMINLANAGTKFVFAEDGNKITVSNYYRGIGATEDYGAVVIGLNIEAHSYDSSKECYAFYRGMTCYNCTGTGYGYGASNKGYGFYNCTCSNCTGKSDGSIWGYGFYNCTCSNCTGIVTEINGTGYGFYNCTCSNCTGIGNANSTDDGFGYGFYNCTCSNCTGTGTGNGSRTGTGNGYGFYGCTCSNCTGTGNGLGYRDSLGSGFYNCTCSNCTGTGTGTGSSTRSGYGFYNCKHCSSCRAGETASTTATWGGTNTYIDSDSCDYVAA